MSEYIIDAKSVPALRVATLRDIVADYSSVGPLYDAIFGALGAAGIAPAGPPMAVYYDPDYTPANVDVEAAVPVADDAALPDGRVTIRTLPAMETAVSLLRTGPYDDFTPAYNAIMEWVRSNGYRMIGPNREIFLLGPEATDDPATYVTEIQFPIAKEE